MKIEVTALYIYPVKSLGGVAVEAAALRAEGLEVNAIRDRQWMIVRPDGRFVTQRECPALARVGTRLDGGRVVLEDGREPPLTLSPDDDAGEPLAVGIWKDRCQAVDSGDHAAAWITVVAGLGEPLRLVRMAPGFSRPQSRPDRYGADTTTHFADGAPYLLAGQASLDTLNDGLRHGGLSPVPMNRFRPNVVMGGLKAFGEHALRRLAGPSFELRPCYPCERCVVTTIDPASGIPDPDRQPFRTLAGLNTMPDRPRAPAFGENAVLTRGEGEFITVGTVLEGA